jgi:hypothetical protein
MSYFFKTYLNREDVIFRASILGKNHFPKDTSQSHE